MKAPSNQPNLNIQASYGSANTSLEYLQFQKQWVRPLVTTELSLTGQFGLAEGKYIYPDQKRGTLFDRTNSGFIGYHFAAALGWKWGGQQNHLQIKLTHHYRDAGIPGLHEFPTQAGNQKDALALAAISLTNHYTKLAIQQDTQINYGFQSRFYSDQSMQPSSDYHKIHGINAQTKFNIPLPWNTIEILASGASQWLNSSALESFGGKSEAGAYHTIDLGLGVKDTMGLLKRMKQNKQYLYYLVFTPSLRIDWDAKFGWFFAYALGLIWSIDQAGHFLVKTTHKNGYHRPAYTDLFWSANAFARGNPDLLPEKSLGQDLQFVIQPIPKSLSQAHGLCPFAGTLYAGDN